MLSSFNGRMLTLKFYRQPIILSTFAMKSFTMAQVPVSGSEVSKVESDVSQTISLAGSVITLLREPVALLYQNINKAQKLK